MTDCQIRTYKKFHNCDEANEHINVIRMWNEGYATMHAGVYDEEYEINFCPFCGIKLIKND